MTHDDDRADSAEKRSEPPSAASPDGDRSDRGEGRERAKAKDPDSSDDTAEQGGSDAANAEERTGSRADVGEGAFRSAHNTYHFYGSVSADSATFGTAGGRSGRRRSTGRIPDHEIDAALRWYVEPSRLVEARRTLDRENLLILTGYEGLGKRTTALALLAEAGTPAPGREYPEVISLSPASSLAALAEGEFKPGHGYLVQDHIGQQADGATHAYDVERLAEALQKAGAHLVITTTAGRTKMRDLSRFVVELDSPPPSELLDRRFAGLDVPDGVRSRARAYVATLHRPRDVLAVAERILAGVDPDSAFGNADEVGRRSVVDWFDAGPGKRDVLYVAALAFLGGQPESLFESRLAKLHELAIPHTDASGAPLLDPSDSFEQRPREHALVTLGRRGHGQAADEGSESYYDQLGWSSGRTVRFRMPQFRRYVLEELHDRFEYRFWGPMRQWLAELPEAEPDPYTQLQLATALAELAEMDFADVLESFLDRWADGTATERATAAMVLWVLADRGAGEMPGVALRTALSWGDGAGLNRAITSAVALGGPLGLAFRPEALRRLCFLALRARRIGLVARLAIAFLFETAIGDGPESTSEVLGTVTKHLRKAVTNGRAGPQAGAGSDRDLYGDDQLYRRQELSGRDLEPDDEDETFEIGWNIRVARAARSLVLAVLTARGSDGEPLVSKILRGQPENVEALGPLWAEVLCSAPHRPKAIEALTEALRGVERAPGAAVPVARLGVAIFGSMPPAHRALRSTDLLRAMSDERRGTRPARVLVSGLLQAVRTQ